MINKIELDKIYHKTLSIFSRIVSISFLDISNIMLLFSAPFVLISTVAV
jgi:hypothetical protein